MEDIRKTCVPNARSNILPMIQYIFKILSLEVDSLSIIHQKTSAYYDTMIDRIFSLCSCLGYGLTTTCLRLFHSKLTFFVPVVHIAGFNSITNYYAHVPQFTHDGDTFTTEILYRSTILKYNIITTTAAAATPADIANAAATTPTSITITTTDASAAVTTTGHH